MWLCNWPVRVVTLVQVVVRTIWGAFVMPTEYEIAVATEAIYEIRCKRTPESTLSSELAVAALEAAERVRSAERSDPHQLQEAAMRLSPF